MNAPKVHIGRAYGHQGLRTHRTLHSAFGPYARLDAPKRPLVSDKTIAIACVIAIAAALLIVNV